MDSEVIFMEKKKRKSKDDRKQFSRAMEVHYQSEFKRADRAFQQSKNQ